MDPTSGEATSGGAERTHGSAERTSGFVRLLLLGVAAASALVVATSQPLAGVPEPAAPVEAACAAPAWSLPPGHPPVPMRGSPSLDGLALPPGHPPLDGPIRRAPRLPGDLPVFEAPATVEI